MKKLSKGFETIFEGVEHRGLAILSLTLVVNGLSPPVLVNIDHSELHYVSEARSTQQAYDLLRARARLP